MSVAPGQDVSATPSLLQPARLLSWRAAVLGVVLLAFAWAYGFLATQLIYQTNQDRRTSDQQHNIVLSLEATERAASALEEDGVWWHVLPHYTGGVVNPLWPWIAGQASKDLEQDAEEERFVRGKWVHVTWTVVFCMVLMVAVARRWTLLGAVNLLVLAGFAVFVQRATYFQPEPVYYAFFFLAWVCGLALMWRNPLWWYAVFGLCAGLAYLAKTSIQPLLLVWGGAAMIRWGWDFLTRRKEITALLEAEEEDRPALVPEENPAWVGWRHWVGLVLLVAGFLAPTLPRLAHTQEEFGSAFHSWPSYWMWFDRFEDCTVFMQEHRERTQLEALAKADKPSLGSYARTHSWEESWDRLSGGVSLVVGELFAPGAVVQKEGRPWQPWRRVVPNRGNYLGWLAVIGLGVGGIAAWQWRGRPVGAAQRATGGALVASVIFVAGAFAIYALSYGWYVAIGKGDRFMLSLYLPLAFTLLWLSERLVRWIDRRWVRLLYGASQAALLGLLCWRLAEVLGQPVFQG